MTSNRLAEAFLVRARARLAALTALRDEADFTDIAREVRDIVDLCFRGILRIRGIEVSRWCDVGDVLEEHFAQFPPEISVHGERCIKFYRFLASAQESIPFPVSPNMSKLHTSGEVDATMADAKWVLEIAQLTVDILDHQRVPISQAP